MDRYSEKTSEFEAKPIKIADATLSLLALDGETPEETPFADIARHIDDAGYESIILSPPSLSSLTKKCALAAIPVITHTTVCLISRPGEKEILYCKGLLKATKKSRIAIDSYYTTANSEEELFPVKRAIKSVLSEGIEAYVILSASMTADEITSSISEYSSLGVTGYILRFSDSCFVPQEVARIVQLAKRETDATGTELSVSFNDDFGIAEANAVHALHSGADSVITVGVRGNTVYTASLLGILEKGGIRGFRSNFNIQEIQKTSAFAAFTSGRSGRRRLPITEGASLRITGRPALARRAVDLGYTLEDEALSHVYSTVRSATSRGIPLTDSALSSAIQDSYLKGRYSLADYQVQSSGSALALAGIEIIDSEVRESVRVTATSKAGADGAILTTLKSFEPFKDMKLLAYTVCGISEGEEVMSEAQVKLFFEGETFVGRALSFDGAEALIKAYISAANRLIAKKIEK